MKARPSSFPALDACQFFEAAEVHRDNYAEAGTDRHAALWAHISGDDGLLDMLPEDEREGVMWAANYIRLHAPMSDHPLIIERPGQFESFESDEPIKGTPDCLCGNDLFDLKWRRRDYRLQMACYARMAYGMGADPTKPINVHVLYGAEQRRDQYRWDYNEVVLLTDQVLIKIGLAQERKPNDYCSWCKHHISCPAILARVNAVVAGREDWFLDQYHSSKIETADEMSRALEIAWVLSDWCKAVEWNAQEMVQKKGMNLAGWKLKERAGKRVITDVQRAFELIDIPPALFLNCCSASISKIEDAVATSGKVVKKKDAKPFVNQKLAEVIELKPSTYSFERSKNA